MAQERVLAFAGGEVGVATLRYLLERGDPVARVIAQDTEEREIFELCAASDIPCESYDETLQAGLAAQGPWDWLLNLWSRHLLRAPIRAACRRRVNLHPSFVPHCRGSDGAAWAIRKGLPAGVSLLEIDDGVDTALVWAQREVAYGPLTKGATLLEASKYALIDLFIETWPRLIAGELRPIPQHGPASSHKRAETNADRARNGDEIDTLENWIKWMLAHDFAPIVTSEAALQGRRYRLRLQIEEIV